MPSRNLQKIYVADSYYHVYNRGVEKRIIFEDELDFRVFLSYFKTALSPEEEHDLEAEEYAPGIKQLRRLNLSQQVELLAFCLLPNHFHLLLYQHNERGIQKLMQSVMTGYVMYFNKRYDRVGRLFQDRYKAVHVDNHAYLAHISRYIHLNSLDAGSSPEEYTYSSYPYYTGQYQAQWMKPNKVLAMHGDNVNDYSEFVRDYIAHKTELDQIEPYLADF